MRTGIFVQVRLGSTRLPSKALLPLAGSTVIGHVMRALHGVRADVRALLTDDESAEVLRGAASAEGFGVFVGPGRDVLGRYCQAARALAVDLVIRATGDNPLTSADLANSIHSLHVACGADVSHYLGNPLGTGVEIIESRALFDAEREASGTDEREHITTWHYRHRDRCVILEPPAPAEAFLREAEVSIDTQADYERIGRIFAHLYDGRPIEAPALVRFLKDAVHA